MANEGVGQWDANQGWQDASIDSISSMLRVNVSQMQSLLKSMFIDGADEKDIRRAMQKFGNSGTSVWGRICPMSPWKATNAPSNTSCRGLTINLTKTIAPTSLFAPVASAGTWIFVQKIWCGVAQRSYGEIALGQVLLLPGASPPGSLTPSLPTQIRFGKDSQASLQGLSAVYGAYNIPAWLTPPIGAEGQSGASLPPYSDPSWSPQNGYLWNPGALTPYVSSSQNSSASYSAIMVLRTARDQPQNSEQLPALYTDGRMITSMNNIYVTTNGAGTSASGVGAAAFIPDVTAPTFSPASLETQGGKNSISQVTLVRSNAADSSEGLRWILGPNVLQLLVPLDYGLMIGGKGGIGRNIWSTTLYPSGMSLGGAQINATVPQAVDAQGSAGPTQCLANNVYDRQNDTFAKVIWISDKFSNVNGTFAQTKQLAPTTCQVAGSTAGGPLVNNIYPRQVLDNTLVQVKDIENVYIPLTNEDAPPIFSFRWSIGMGAGNAGPLGQGCHVFCQVMSDDSVSWLQVPFGLGVYGNSTNPSFGATQSSYWQGYGVIPGGMPNELATEIQVPVQPQVPYSYTRQWTWAGSFVCFTAMPNAQQQVSLTIKVPLEYEDGVTGPAFVTRVDGVSQDQQLVYSSRSSWEVLATASTRSVDNKSGNLVRPMVDSRFPDLVRDLFESERAVFFKTVLDEQSWQERVYMTMTCNSTRKFIELLKQQEFVRDPNDPLHERVAAMLAPPEKRQRDVDVSQILNQIDNVRSELDSVRAENASALQACARQIKSASGNFFGDVLGGISQVADTAAHVGMAVAPYAGMLASGSMYGAPECEASAMYGAPAEAAAMYGAPEEASGHMYGSSGRFTSQFSSAAAHPLTQMLAGRLLDKYLPQATGPMGSAVIGDDGKLVSYNPDSFQADGQGWGAKGASLNDEGGVRVPGAVYCSSIYGYLGAPIDLLTEGPPSTWPTKNFITAFEAAETDFNQKSEGVAIRFVPVIDIIKYGQEMSDRLISSAPSTPAMFKTAGVEQIVACFFQGQPWAAQVGAHTPTYLEQVAKHVSPYYRPGQVLLEDQDIYRDERTAIPNGGYTVSHEKRGNRWKICRSNPAYNAIGIMIDVIYGRVRYSILPATYAHLVLRVGRYIAAIRRQEMMATSEFHTAKPHFSEAQALMLSRPERFADRVQSFWKRKDRLVDKTRIVPGGISRVSGFPTAIVMNHILMYTASALIQAPFTGKKQKLQFVLWHNVRQAINDNSDTKDLRGEVHAAHRAFARDIMWSGSGVKANFAPMAANGQQNDNAQDAQDAARQADVDAQAVPGAPPPPPPEHIKRD